jgi:hypothetical protein
LIHAPAIDASLELWWNSNLQGRPKRQRCKVAALLIYTVWSLWKERIRRVFQGVLLVPERVFLLMKGEMQLRVMAMSGRVEGLGS